MNKYSEQQKLDAVEGYRSGELGLRATAALRNVDVASLRKWVAAYEAIGIAGIQRKRRQTYDLKFKVEVLQKLKSEELSYRRPLVVSCGIQQSESLLVVEPGGQRWALEWRRCSPARWAYSRRGWLRM